MISKEIRNLIGSITSAKENFRGPMGEIPWLKKVRLIK
jgi:hypothetical protein